MKACQAASAIRIGFSARSKRRPFSCIFIFGESRADALESSCCNARETHVLRELVDRVHCRNKASNCPRATVQFVSAELPPQMPQSIVLEIADNGDESIENTPANVNCEHSLARAAD